MAGLTISERLQALRKWMQDQDIEAFIIPSNDPHFSEYVADHWGCRAWISGFDGSAGTVVVTQQQAALWTDSRYFLQAEKQLAGSGIELQRTGMEGAPTIAEWLGQFSIQYIGIDGRLFSKNGYDQLNTELDTKGLSLRPTDDPFRVIWTDRPELPAAKAMLLDIQYSGESTQSKLDRIREQQPEQAVRIVAVLDEIAWTLNIRGQDIDYNPVVVSYLSIEPNSAKLFVDPAKFSEKDRQILLDEADVEILPYEDFGAYLGSLGGRKVIVHPNGLDQYHYSLLAEHGAIIREETTSYGLISGMKAIKNSTETAGFRRAMEMDGIALVRFEIGLEQALNAGLRPTELEIAEKLHEFRTQGEGFQGESFGTISGYGAHGAIVHYQVTQGSDISVGLDSFLLIDSGAQYLFGTTDITRTYHFGTPTDDQKRDYTAVLKGMIDLSAAQFPIGTRGSQLDILARRHLWQQGQNYLHGTGHGVGHFLCVHEGPQSIRMNENPVVLQSGMVQSCEPGLYLAEKYGIRIENLTLVVESDRSGFLCFEPLTLCPIQTIALDTESLEKPQKAWLDWYHTMVYARLKPYLNAEEREWLREKTAPIG